MATLWQPSEKNLSVFVMIYSGFYTFFVLIPLCHSMGSAGPGAGKNKKKIWSCQFLFANECGCRVMIKLIVAMYTHLVCRSHWAVSLPTAKRLGPHIGRYKVAVSESSRSTQEVSQAVGDTGGRVAPSLLCSCIT